MTLDQIRKKAQIEANRSQHPMAILNLNRFYPLYVIRYLEDRMPGLVEVIQPDPSQQAIKQ